MAKGTAVVAAIAVAWLGLLASVVHGKGFEALQTAQVRGRLGRVSVVDSNSSTVRLEVPPETLFVSLAPEGRSLAPDEDEDAIAEEDDWEQEQGPDAIVVEVVPFDLGSDEVNHTQIGALWNQTILILVDTDEEGEEAPEEDPPAVPEADEDQKRREEEEFTRVLLLSYTRFLRQEQTSKRGGCEDGVLGGFDESFFLRSLPGESYPRAREQTDSSFGIIAISVLIIILYCVVIFGALYIILILVQSLLTLR